MLQPLVTVKPNALYDAVFRPVLLIWEDKSCVVMVGAGCGCVLRNFCSLHSLKLYVFFFVQRARVLEPTLVMEHLINVEMYGE